MRPAAGLAAVSVLIASAGAAQDLEEYRHFREERFAEVSKANPNMQAQAAAVKVQTAALLAKAPAKLAPLDAPPTLWRVPSTLPFILDNLVAPRMVIVPAGEFTRGSARNEAGRVATDGPRRRVRIGYAFAVGMFPVTFAEYSFFAKETGHVGRGSCASPGAKPVGGLRDWGNPGFAQTFRSPAVCIGYADAVAYTVWLSGKTGHRYRLLTEAEYEYAQRGGSTSPWWWGDALSAGCGIEMDCPTKTEFTSDVGILKPNGFGLFDTTGNVASWTSDCWGPSRDGKCRERVVRGASWATTDLRSAARRKERDDTVSADLGFRVAREL